MDDQTQKPLDTPDMGGEEAQQVQGLQAPPAPSPVQADATQQAQPPANPLDRFQQFGTDNGWTQPTGNVTPEWNQAYQAVKQNPFSFTQDRIATLKANSASAFQHARAANDVSQVLPQIDAHIEAVNSRMTQAQGAVDAARAKLTVPAPTMPGSVQPNLGETIAAGLGMFGGARGAAGSMGAAENIAATRQQTTFDNAMRQFNLDRENAQNDFSNGLKDVDFYRGLGEDLQGQRTATQEKSLEQGGQLDLANIQNNNDLDRVGLEAAIKDYQTTGDQNFERDMADAHDRMQEGLEQNGFKRDIASTFVKSALQTINPDEAETAYRGALGLAGLTPGPQDAALIKSLRAGAQERHDAAERDYGEEMLKTLGDYHTKNLQAQIALAKLLNGKNGGITTDEFGAPQFGGAQLSNGKIDYSDLLSKAEQENGLPPGLLGQIMKFESDGNPNIKDSKAGAEGLMQFEPGTAKDLGINPRDPAQAIQGAGKYLGQLRDQFGGDLTKAVAAYNSGPRNVQKYGGVPPFKETQAYVKNVLGGQGGQGGATLYPDLTDRHSVTQDGSRLDLAAGRWTLSDKALNGEVNKLRDANIARDQAKAQAPKDPNGTPVYDEATARKLWGGSTPIAKSQMSQWKSWNKEFQTAGTNLKARQSDVENDLTAPARGQRAVAALQTKRMLGEFSPGSPQVKQSLSQTNDPVEQQSIISHAKQLQASVRSSFRAATGHEFDDSVIQQDLNRFLATPEGKQTQAQLDARQKALGQRGKQAMAATSQP